ncbi:IS200/IS605 family transposase [Succinatimonas hippei]|uniref:IS200/IS605 family transposase n=1 Tax=Succinatimonas hippei TaxID=626938 RepID=UPI0023F9A05C|nr:IS200/IS605 family transposase [Succinatimonas hippei]
MKKTTVYHTRHCSYNLHVRLIFVTTYRRKVFTARIINELKTIFETVCLQFNAGLIEFDGEEVHVHLLILYPPKLSIANLVFKLKGTSSVIIRNRNYPSVKSQLWGKALCSPSYFASSCTGAPISIIHQYIDRQKTPD